MVFYMWSWTVWAGECFSSVCVIFFLKQTTAYEMRISDWSSDVCSSDLQDPAARDYVYNNHKDLWWIENDTTVRGMYLNDQGKSSNDWKMSDAQEHGAIGDHFHKALPWGLKMGDPPSLARKGAG